MRIALFIFSCFLPFLLRAQFAPRAGKPGSTAVHKDSSLIIGWATGCTAQRGWKDISRPDSGRASTGNEQATIGKADASVLSLGDGGHAVLTFDPPIVNGPGADFAVFENGFNILAGNDSDFLELAFVEASSDGVHFFRFPAFSENDTVTQLSGFSGMKASRIHNLAGKYTSGFGTPFDLEDLPADPLLNLEQITHLRITDVIGSLNDSFATRDSRGNKINDPWPTPFPSSGFDLDAVGVIHNVLFPNSLERISAKKPGIFPNPLKKGEMLHISNLPVEAASIRITDFHGKTWFSSAEEDITGINTEALPPGLYFISIYTSAGVWGENILIL
jgi:hypothetical protein